MTELKKEFIDFCNSIKVESPFLDDHDEDYNQNMIGLYDARMESSWEGHNLTAQLIWEEQQKKIDIAIKALNNIRKSEPEKMRLKAIEALKEMESL